MSTIIINFVNVEVLHYNPIVLGKFLVCQIIKETHYMLNRPTVLLSCYTPNRIISYWGVIRLG